TGGSSRISQTSPYDVVTIKYGTSGQEQWVARYNSAANEEDGGRAIAVDGSSNVYVTGVVGDGSGFNSSYLTIKYDPSGGVDWEDRYSAVPGSYNNVPSAITIDQSGNVYVTGYASTGF